MALSPLPADKPKETLGTWAERVVQLGSSSQMFSMYPRLTDTVWIPQITPTGSQGAPL